MNFLNPIYTEKTECQDCYKCVRHCPVKAIKVESGCATVISELCIYCGHCVEVCPNGAKKVRDDLARARQLLGLRERVYVSLAPSFIADFPGVAPAQLIAALRRLGFAGVSETALGAQEVSAAVAAQLATGPAGLMISSACPSVVAYLQKHRPALTANLTAMHSPLLAHCRLLRRLYGSDIGIVFVGPCIGKKLDADEHPELLDVALTYEELRRWLAAEKIVPAALEPTPQDTFVPERSAEGAWYAVDGGMIAGVKSNCAVNDCSMMSFSGMPAIEKALAELPASPQRGLFLELLACEGGCVNGPKSASRGGTIAKRCRVLEYGQAAPPSMAFAPGANDSPLIVPAEFRALAAVRPQYSESQVREALRAVGKYSAEDELNCGGCGYDSCLAFGRALLAQKAERSMCVTYMRKLAHKKANVLVQRMRSAVVIVGESLRIIECNAAFVRLFVPDNRPDEEKMRAMEGLPLSSVLPFANLFQGVMSSGDDLPDRYLRHQKTIIQASIFTIEKHAVVGAILQDVTRPSVQKEEVIRKAREVIQKNLATVQQIAYLLGENAAESEITLNQIIDSFSPPQVDDPGDKRHDDWRKLYRR
jgi:iron only hydrogenase large subunit-like protein